MGWRWWLVLVVLFGSSGCREHALEEISIERDSRTLRAIPRHPDFVDWEEVDGALYRARYMVPPTFLEVPAADESRGDDDPFAEPAVTRQRAIGSAREILENAGVSFGEGTSASYNPRTSVLTVVQTEEQLFLVEAFIGCPVYERFEKTILVRSEFYRVPIATALTVVESAQAMGDHTPERDALRKSWKEGGASLIAVPTVVCRSGQRAVVSAGFGRSEETGESPGAESHTLCEFEVDPVLGADSLTIDVGLRVALGSRRAEGLQRKLETQVVILDQQWALAGAWSVESETILVFFTASIQSVGGDVRVVGAAANPEPQSGRE